MKLLRQLPLAVAFAVAMETSAIAQVEQIQIIVPAEVAVESTSNKAVIAALKAAEGEAAKNAWRVIKMRPNIALKVRNFTADQNAQVSQGLSAPCQVMLLDHTVDKKLKRVSARYRFDCNQQDIITGLDQYQSQNAGQIADGGGAQRPLVASFFLVKEVESVTSFDADIDRRGSTSARADVTATSSSTTQYQTDDRLRAQGSAATRVSGTETWSENGASLTEGLDVKQNAKLSARVEGRGKSTTSENASLNTVVANDVSQTQQGRTINRAAVSKYRSASPEELNTALTDVLKNAGVRVVQYSDFPPECAGPNADAIAREFGDRDEDLSSTVRAAIVRAARACQVKYLIIGEALVDGTQADPFNGAPKTSVVMRAKVWRIDSPIPEIVSTIQKDSAASNSNLNVARSNAVFQGAQQTGEEILARMTAEGIR